MNTPDEIVRNYIETSIRVQRDIEKALWERYDATGDVKFLTALSCSGDARNNLVKLKEMIKDNNPKV